ncbi:Gfo/Idh/MocA family protein [Pedobacter glucosidilyticus]|uniref:Gfo/Idh/MocA family protein n=1 Tax=Pedobacter glucosidilyticus TaxID=1122941 RepID=UPI0026EB14A8|nr:Gfo/Idh/MocA family oxidoreductase [Pedobacter glucosidilyticus]
MERKIRAGLMAYGMSGKVFHAPFLDQHLGFELVAIVERSKNEAIKDYPYIIQYRDHENLLADESLELIVINTPNFTHYEYAKAALNAGKHILIEKPLSVLKAEAEELFALAFRKNLQVFAYQNRRFDSDYLSVKEVLDSKKLGNIIEAHFRFDRYRPEVSHKFFKEQAMPGAGILYDLGAHIIDQAISLFGVPDDFVKTYGNNRPITEVDDYAHVHLKYKNGLNVYISTSLLVANPLPSYVLHGTKGSFTKHRTDVQEEQLLAGIKPLDDNYGIEKPNSEGVLVYYDDENQQHQELLKAKQANYMHLFDHVYEAIIHQKPYYVKQNEIIAQLSILEK